MISRNAGYYALAETYIGEGNQVCINPKTKITPPGKFHYILLKDYANCSQLDNRWIF